MVSVPVDDKLSTLSIPPWSRFVYTIPPNFEAVVPTPLTNRSRTFELNEYLDEIKNRLKVSTVVSKTVSLKKRGKEFVGLSPFKNEKTPSFTVNDEKEFYHCFATSEHGNIFDFVMKTQNLKFGEAVKALANLAGMRPYTFSKQDEEREKNWIEYKSI